MAKEIVFITGNPKKLGRAREAFAKYDVKVTHVDMETPEIQADDVEEVARYSAVWASSKLNKPVLLTDASWSITALNGFPGPYIRYVAKTLSSKGLLKLMEGVENREIIFKEAFAYCEPGKEPMVESCELKGRVIEKIVGKESSRWSIDPIVIMEGSDKTLYNLTQEENNKIFTKGRALEKLIERII